MKRIKQFISVHPIWFDIIIALLFSFVYCLINSTFLSPIYVGVPYGSVNQDSQFFYYLGTLLANGQTPYIQFFDHKGLYHISINALGYILGGRIPLFFIEILFYFVATFFFIRTIRMLSKNSRATYLVSLCLLFALLALFKQSNGEGTWLLPFVSLSMFFFVKARLNNEHFYIISGLFIGLEIALALNSRPSDAIFGGVMALAYIVFLIKEKLVKTLLLTALTAFSSLCIIMVAFYLPAYFGGYMKEMFNATILHNLLYMSKTPPDFDLVINKIIAALFLVYGLIMTIVIYKNKKTDSFSFVFSFMILGISFLYVLIAHYLAYFQSISYFLAIYIVYSFTKLFKLEKTEKAFSIATPILMCGELVAFLALCYGSVNPLLSYKEYKILENNLSLISSDVRHTPGSIYVIDCKTSIYIQGEIITNNKYVSNQSWWSYADGKIKEEVKTYIVTNKPQYIFLGTGAEKEYFLSAMSNIYEVFENPNYIASNEYTLYVRK